MEPSLSGIPQGALQQELTHRVGLPSETGGPALYTLVPVNHWLSLLEGVKEVITLRLVSPAEGSSPEMGQL